MNPVFVYTPGDVIGAIACAVVAIGLLGMGAVALFDELRNARRRRQAIRDAHRGRPNP